MTLPTADLLIAALWRDLAPTPETWPAIIAESQQHGLLPALAFLAASTPLPEPLAEQLRQVRLRAGLRYLYADQQLLKIGALAHALDIPLILLKGRVTAAAYSHPAARPFSDLDFLAPSETLAQRLFTALQAQGYRTFSESRSGHLTPLAPPDRNLTIEIHCDAFEILPILRSDELYWTAARPVPDLPGLLALSPVDHALYITIHAIEKHGFDMGLRGLYDFSCWTRLWDEATWRAVVTRAEVRGAAQHLRLITALETWARGMQWEAMPWGRLLSPPPEPVIAEARRALFRESRVTLPSVWRDLPRDGVKGWWAYGCEIITSGGTLRWTQVPGRITYLLRTHGPGLWKLLRHQPDVQRTWSTQRALQDWLHQTPEAR